MAVQGKATKAAKNPAPKAAAGARHPRPAETHPGQKAFAHELALEAKAEHPELTEAMIERTLDKARYEQSIIDAITRPAESKQWKDYRPLFLTDRRVSEGIAFYRSESATLAQVSQRTGVPPEIIVAIVGVETFYGRNTGKYRALDALATLAFHYPQRAPFFRSELKQLFLLTGPNFPALEQLTGSYAGAMGMGQFMPSSIAQYAIDGDGDGKLDLWGSRADALASIGNYLMGYGWSAGAPIAEPAQATDAAQAFNPPNLETNFTLGELAQKGYAPAGAREASLAATLLTLQGEQGDERWIAYHNFYVISRYNRSPLYCMAVHQLAQAIAAGVANAPPSAAAR